MMMRNDHDILPQVLECNLPHFDAIYVLDGSEDSEGTRAIFSKHADKVRGIYRDSDLPSAYGRPPRDGARQFLLEKIKADIGDEGWVFCLHSDEMFYDLSPKAMVGAAEQYGCDCILVRNVHFFLHSSQEKTYRYDPDAPVFDQIRFASFPGFPELRAFKNGPAIAYEINRHSCVMPDGLARMLQTPFAVRHYLYRDPAQMLTNMKDRFERGWQTYGKRWHDERQSCFLDVLPGYEFSCEVRRDQKIIDGITGVLSQ